MVGAVVAPIQNLAKGANEIARGNLDYAISIKTKDEIGDLGTAFNKMTTDLKRSRDELISNIQILKKAEIEIKKAYEITQDILEKAPFGIYVVNQEGYIEYVNPAMLKISGDSLDNFKKMNAFELESYKKTGLDDKIRFALDGGTFFYGPIEYVSSLSGRATIRNFTGMPLWASDNSKKALVFVEDVTELKKTQLQLIQVEKMEIVGRLASGIAHEVKNPLAIILQCVEYLKNRIDPNNETITMTLNHIKDAVKRADNVVRGLLDFSGSSRIDIRLASLKRVLERSVFLLKHQFDKYHINVIKKID